MMRHQFALRTIGLVLGLFSCTAAWSATTAFSDTYMGSGSGAKCDTNYAITGVIPAGAAKRPVFVYLVGTSESHDNAQARAAVAGMGARGFVAASVQYRSEVFGTCAEIAQKAACVFKPESTTSAISKLCVLGDCAKGIVVAGFSQGSIAAILAKQTEARVKAVYGMGSFPNYTANYNMASCMNNGKHVLRAKNLRIVNGERDFFGGSTAKAVRSGSKAVTGKDCGPSAFSCLNSNGSGWIMVRNTQVKDKSADHCYQRASSDCSGNQNVIDAKWKSGTESWSLPSNLNWLKTFVKP